MFNMYPGAIVNNSPGLAPCPGETFTFQASPSETSSHYDEVEAGDNTYVLGMAMAGAMVTANFSPSTSSPSPAPSGTTVSSSSSTTSSVSTFPTSPGKMENLTVDLTNYNMISPHHHHQLDRKKHWIEDELAREKTEGKEDKMNLEDIIKKEKEEDWGKEVVHEPRRFKRGRLPVNDKRMTPYELMKKERRREQNRRAARKCREKRKKQQDLVYEDYTRLQDENDMLKSACDDYQIQLDELFTTLRQHELNCNLVASGQLKTFTQYPPTPMPTPGAHRSRCVSTSSSTNFDNGYNNYGDCCYVENNCLETSVTPPMTNGGNTQVGYATEATVDHMLSDEIAEFVFEHNN